jgi:ABC-2 type transport system permease protein
MQPEFVVAIKEFKDYLSSKRFLLIFGVLVLITIAAIIAGISSYNSELTTYKDALSRPVSTNATGMADRTPTMPSMLLVFSSFTDTFVIVGWLLAIAIGFDLISKEKETGSLKLLLARPVFRDSIINGKIIGSASILIISLVATFLVALAILLFGGIVPTGDDMARLGTYFLLIVLFCITFLAIGIAASAIARNSTIAILLAIGFVVFSLLLPNFSSTVCDIVLGQAPSMISYSASTTTGGSGSRSSTSGFAGDNGGFGSNGTAFRGGAINPAYTAYYNTRNEITEAIDLLSPTSDLSSIATVVVDRQSSPASATISTTGSGVFQMVRLGITTPSLGSSLPSILPQILALVVMTIAGFAISYAKFTRMDVR